MSLCTVIIYDNENDNLKHCINSIGHIESLEFDVIVISEEKDMLNDKSSSITWLQKGGKGIYNDYNNALSQANGDYIIFTKSSSYYKPKYIKKISQIMLENDYDILNINGIQDRGEEKKRRFAKKIMEQEKLICNDINNEIPMINFLLDSYFVKSDIAKSYNFDINIYDDANEKYIIDIISKSKTIYQDGQITCYYKEPLDNNTSAYPRQFEKWWYVPSIKNFLLPMLQSSNGYLIQRYLYYLLFLKFECNKNAFYRRVIENEDVDIFFQLVEKCFEYIDEEVIVESVYGKVPDFMKIHFLKQKSSNDDLNVDLYDDETASVKMKAIDILGRIEPAVHITNLNIYSDTLIIDGYFKPRILIDNGCDLYLSVEGQEFSIDDSDNYSKTLYFGKIFSSRYTINHTIDLEEKKSKKTIKFILKKDGKQISPKMRFDKPQSRLNDFYSCHYCVLKNRTIQYKQSKRSITVGPTKRLDTLKNELSILTKVWGTNNTLKVKSVLFFWRILYWLTKIYYGNKDIWVYYDKLYRAGDNGEYFFEYSKSQKDDIKHFYILNENAPDYERMYSTYKKSIMPSKSMKKRIIGLHSTKILATHSLIFKRLGFSKHASKYFSNLLTADVAYIRHGISIHYAPQAVARTIDNTSYFFCTSKYEVNNISRPEYGYLPEMLKMTGSARLDGLIPNNKKKILISPTWRKALSMKSEALHLAKPYNPSFKNSDFFRIYNGLLNDNKLVNFMKSRGFTIQFLLHPNLSPQYEDFNVPDGVELLAATEDISYRKLMTEADIMVTDISGIQFDFAYMKKPLIYFQPDFLHKAHENSVFDYGENGFGPIIQNSAGLVDNLIATVERNCVMEQKYLNRVDDFFMYQDYDNCKRIYNTLKSDS